MSFFSPFRRRLNLAWMNLPWNRGGLIREVLQHHVNQLPDRVNVSWVRDGKVIVGKIFFTENENDFIMTQGSNATEFVEMVNDAILSACEIPDEYLSAVARMTKIQPPPQEMAKLLDGSVMAGVMTVPKTDLVAA